MNRIEQLEAEIREYELRKEEINTNLTNMINNAHYRKIEIDEMIENKKRLIERYRKEPTEPLY